MKKKSIKTAQNLSITKNAHVHMTYIGIYNLYMTKVCSFWVHMTYLFCQNNVPVIILYKYVPTKYNCIVFAWKISKVLLLLLFILNFLWVNYTTASFPLSNIIYAREVPSHGTWSFIDCLYSQLAQSRGCRGWKMTKRGINNQTARNHY